MDDAECIAYLRVVLDGKNLVECGVIPHIWMNASIFMGMFLEEPMHGLFLGCVGTVYEVMEQFMAKESNKATFERYINQYLFDVRDFRLSFCAVREFPKSQWISENLIAIARLNRFIYGHYFSTIKVKDQTAVDSAMRMITSLDVMVSQLMYNPDDDDEIDLDYVEDVVKIFLSCCVEFATHLTKSGDCNFMEKANFFSLLNLVDQIKEYGSLRKWWGGSFEADIGKVKGELKYMRKSQAFLATKLKATRKKYYHNEISNRWFNEDKSSTRQKLDYHRAESPEVIISRFNAGDVISVFRLKTDPQVWYAAFGKDRDFVKVMRIYLPAGSGMVEVKGTYYHKFSLDKYYFQPGRDRINTNIAEFGIMLPAPASIVNETGFFSIITDRWRTLDEDGRTSLSKLPMSLFDTIIPPTNFEHALVGQKIGILFRYIDDKTKECGLDWYYGEICRYIQPSEKHLILWEGGGSELVHLSPDDYGSNHHELGWKIVKN